MEAISWSVKSLPIPPTRLLSNGTSASRIFAVVAEPQSEDANHLLHSVRDGRVEGLGIWKSELRSGWVGAILHDHGTASECRD
jgi:hypothetical protein